MLTIPQNHDNDTIRTGVLASLRGNQQEHLKVSSCRPFSGCTSIYCPSCRQRAGYLQGQRIFRAASRTPAKRWKLATLKASNVPLEGLRDAAQAIMKAARSTIKRLRCADSAIRFECSVTDRWEDYHPHLHALIDPPSGGRNHVSAATIQDAWLDELDSWLHPSMDAIHVDDVHNLGAASTYISKSPFRQKNDVPTGGMIGKIVAGIHALKGLPKFALHGTLAGA